MELLSPPPLNPHPEVNNDNSPDRPLPQAGCLIAKETASGQEETISFYCII